MDNKSKGPPGGGGPITGARDASKSDPHFTIIEAGLQERPPAAYPDPDLICSQADAQGRRFVLGDPNLVFDQVRGVWLDDGQPLLEGTLAYLVDLASAEQRANEQLPADVAGSLGAILQPGQVFEIRILDYPKRPDYRVTLSGYFDDPVKAAAAVKPYAGRANVYFTPNPINPALLARANGRLIERPKATTADKDIAARKWILLDIDPQRPAGISATDQEKSAALALAGKVRADLAGVGWQPAIFADSGNGYQFYYRADLSIEPAITDQVSALLNGLAGRHDTDQAKVDTSVYNLARIWKVPGTKAVKGDPLPDRPHRTAKILELNHDAPVITIDALTAVVDGLAAADDQVKPKKQPAQPTAPGGYQGRGRPITAPEIREGLKAAGVGYTEVAKLDEITFRLSKCLTSEAHTDGAALLLTTSGQEAGKIAYKCCHNSCSGKQWADVKQIVLPARSAAQQEASKPFRLDDIGNSERFVAQHGQVVRYVHRWGRWLIYDGRHWAADDNGLVDQLAAQTTRSIYEEASSAAKAGNEQLAADLSKWARASAHLTRRRAMLETAKSDPGVAIRFTELDKSPMLLNCRNGTINLKTGDLLPHDPAHLITHCLPVAYDRGATCPQWERFLTHILPDESTRRFVQKAVGYSLSGLIVEQILFFLHGAGANGKSTLLTILTDLLGGLAARIRAESLLLKDRDSIPNDIAGLTGARLVVTSELTGNRSLNESMVKDLTGGDSITARFLHQEFFTFTPIFKIWMYGNAKPTIRGTDDGIWRRIRLIPFTVQIPEDERDGALVGKLREELPGVLNWALDGWKAYQAEGLRPSAAVSRATDAYREQSDALGQFLTDCCLVQDGATSQSKLLHDAYLRWGGTMTAVKFAQVMQERGFTKKREMHGMTWQGVGLLADSM